MPFKLGTHKSTLSYQLTPFLHPLRLRALDTRLSFRIIPTILVLPQLLLSTVIFHHKSCLHPASALPTLIFASRDNGHGNGIIVGTGTEEMFTVQINMSSAEPNTSGPMKVEPIGIPDEHGTLSLSRTYALHTRSIGIQQAEPIGGIQQVVLMLCMYVCTRSQTHKSQASRPNWNSK